MVTSPGAQDTARAPRSPERRARVGSPSVGLWLIAAVGLSLLFSARTMGPAFAPDVVQGDARQHVFWTARLWDPALFPGDVIADYYQSVAPPGFSAVYWLAIRAVDPLLASKLLPPLLGVASAVVVFGLVRRLSGGPPGAFLATVLLSWYVWQYDDLPSATARAFMLPLLGGLLWALVAGRRGVVVGLVAALALVYPFGALLGLALLAVRLVRWRGWRPGLVREQQDWLGFVAACMLVASLLLPARLTAEQFGPTVSLAEARALADFGPSGRTPYFVEDGYRYWIASGRSGLDLRVTDVLLPDVPIFYLYLGLALLLPIVLARRYATRRERPPPGLELLPQVLLASFGLFFLAHLLLFQLYLPSRYVKTSVPLLLSVSAGLALGMLIEAAAACFGARRHLVTGCAALVLGLAIAAYPGRYAGAFHRDEIPAITAYLRSQPKDTLVAGASEETDQVPVFAARSVLVAREYLLPYQLGYYREMHRRMLDLIEGYYAESPGAVAAFAERYGVDVFLVNRDAFDRTRFRRAWNFARSEQTFAPIIAEQFERNRRFALLDLADRCAEADDGTVAAVPASCILGRAAP